MPYNDTRDREEWRGVRRETNRFLGLGIWVWVVIVVVALAIGAGIWALNVATSGVRGQGDGIIQKNSAENWLDAQERFEENYAEYESTLTRIDVFYEVYKGSPTEFTAKTNWLGQISHCTDVVASYNADANNFLREDFQRAALPDQLDPSTCTKTQETTP